MLLIITWHISFMAIQEGMWKLVREKLVEKQTDEQKLKKKIRLWLKVLRISKLYTKCICFLAHIDITAPVSTIYIIYLHQMCNLIMRKSILISLFQFFKQKSSNNNEIGGNRLIFLSSINALTFLSILGVPFLHTFFKNIISSTQTKWLSSYLTCNLKNTNFTKDLINYWSKPNSFSCSSDKEYQ